MVSCTWTPEEEPGASPSLGSAAQALTDTDSDSLDDDWEIQYFGNLSQTSAGDFDLDGMTNGEEYLHGFNPTVADSLEDADGDRYPNIFEIRGGADPNNASSIPTPTYVVNGAGGGTHTTISAAVTAANVANGAYQIIGIAPGTYTGSANRGLTFAATKPKFLLIGLEGAAKTIIDGVGAGPGLPGWHFNNTAVVSSLTFQRELTAIYINAASADVRLVDLVVRDNATTGAYAGGVHVVSAARVHITGTTFLNNGGTASSQQIYIGPWTAATLTNTVVWGAATTGTMLGKATSATLTTNYCLVKGQTLAGTGNLAGSVDPKLRSDGHLLWDSPLRGVGGTAPPSRIDMDGELRPSAPDIGADQFLDSDADELADAWEHEQTGGLTTLTSRSQDADSDGLTNGQEHVALTSAIVADTDGDGLSDGDEVTVHSTNPLVTDTDGDDMPDAWEVAHGLSPIVPNGLNDFDGDRYPDVFEYASSTDPADPSSKPTPTYTVNGAGGGTHTTIGAALAAANVSNGAYQIIGIAPGIYTGIANLRDVTIAATKPKLLFIGLEGAAKTIIDGGLTNWGWIVSNSAVISSLTFQRANVALYVDALTKDVRFVDLVVRDNIGLSWAAGVHVNWAGKVQITGSTFLDNTGMTSAQQIWMGPGAATITNTVVWGQTTATMVAKAASATLTTNHCLVKGQTLAGTGNLAGSVNPKLRSDVHLLWDSPLRGAGGTVPQSRIDMDGELRPSSAPDIGADHFLDSDADQLADKWELDETGALTTLTSRMQDADGDGLANEHEYAAYAKPTVADTDGDGLSDGDEVNLHSTSPLKTDTDADDMPDAWEVANGLNPIVANTFADQDSDGYPDVYEYARGTNPSDRESIPTPTYLVNGAGGGTHTTISAALASANIVNGAYQIIGIAPGMYTGAANLRDVTIAATKPKLLIIGLEGAAKTIIDGGLANYGWLINNSAVIASLTFRKATVAAYVDAPGKEVRFVDLLVRDNVGPSWAGGVHVNAATAVHIVGSTFLNNTGFATAQQVWIGAGAGTIVNTVVWGKTSGTMLAKATNATLSTSQCLVKGQTLTGTGNLAGTVDPKLRTDAHLRSNSPLRGAGGSPVQSRIDMDGELRPASARDIGVDQFNDVDSDGLADGWELATAGNTTAIAGGADADNDELSNAAEYDLETAWLDPDTDNDGVMDGVEVAVGTNPLLADVDDLASDLNQDGLIDSVGAQLGYQPNQLDSDGDSVSNADEVLMCTNPLRADTDGDGVPDSTDAFPLDPRRSALVSDPQDITPPVITLTAPWFAVEQ